MFVKKRTDYRDRYVGDRAVNEVVGDEIFASEVGEKSSRMSTCLFALTSCFCLSCLYDFSGLRDAKCL